MEINDIKPGDILVCLPGFTTSDYANLSKKNVSDAGGAGYEDGLMGKANAERDNDIQWNFKGGNGVHARALRKATDLEKSAFEKGIKNINDINKMLDLIKGDNVSFLDAKSGKIETYYSEIDGIPSKMLIHGNIILQDNIGEVIDFYKEYVIVKYRNDKNKSTQLGFKREQLVLLVDNKTFTISYVDADGKTNKVTVEAESEVKALASLKNKQHVNYIIGG